MIDYAAQDVGYLIPLYKMLKEELKKKNRLFWVNEECKYLSRVRPPKTKTRPLYLKFKGAGRLAPENLAILEAILRYRDRIAKRKDKPHFKVLSNTAIMKICCDKPRTYRQLKESKSLSKRQMEMYGKSLIAAVKRAMMTPPDQLPIFPKNRAPRLPPDVPPRIKTIRMWRDNLAKKLEVAPSLLLNRSLISAIAHKNPGYTKDLAEIQEIKNWQIKEFGDQILSLINQP